MSRTEARPRLIDVFQQNERFLSALQLVAFMAGMGLELSIADFRAALTGDRKSIAIFIFCQYFVGPALAVAVINFLQLPFGAAVGLILIACMPGGTFSNVITFWGRGNAPLSVALTASTTLASIVTVPIWLNHLLARSTADLDAQAFSVVVRTPFLKILFDVTTLLLAPLVVGMIVRARLEERRRELIERAARALIRLGTALLVAIVILSMLSGRARPADFSPSILVGVIVFCVICQQSGMIPIRIIGGRPVNRLAIGIELTIRDVNLAILLFTTLYPNPADRLTQAALETYYVLLCYGFTSLAAAIVTIIVYRVILKEK
jgi:BASS family bile acid:Na+ symporter